MNAACATTTSRRVRGSGVKRRAVKGHEFGLQLTAAIRRLSLRF